MAIVISGASGFLGRRLVAHLANQGAKVIAISRLPVPSNIISNRNIRWVIWEPEQLDFNLFGFNEIEAVIHLAGATLGAGKDESLFFQSNEHTTVRLCQALAERTKLFIFASSQVVYGDARHLGVTEDFPLRPDASAYACSKLNSENWLRWFQKRHGGQYLALRFCGFIEGGGIVDYIIDQALIGQPIELYSQGLVRRDYLPIADAIDVLTAALNVQASPEFLPVNIGSGQAVSSHELATLICDELQSTSSIELSSEPSPQGDFVFCIDLARQLFGFQPGKLTDAVRYYAQHRKEEVQRRGRNEKN